MAVATLVSLAGFGMLFSQWWGSNISDPQEILRIASQEFVAGHTIVAGDLAETVQFDLAPDLVPDQPEDPVEPEAPRQPPTDTDPGTEDASPSETQGGPETNLPEQANSDQANSDQANSELVQANEEKERWIRVRDFLVGAGKYARAAKEENKRDQRQVLMEAALPLQRAARGGFPPGRVTQGNQMLGEILYQLGRYEEAIPALTRAVEGDPTLSRDLLPLIADAHLRLPKPQAQLALQTIDRFLTDRSLTLPQQWKGELIRLRALTELRDYAQVDQQVNQIRIRDRARDATLEGKEIAFRHRVDLLAAARHIQQAIASDAPHDQLSTQEALDLIIRDLGQLQREASPKTAARSRLWQARALMVVGKEDDALTQFTAVRQQRPFGAEAIVGGLEEIEWLASRGRGVEVLQTTRYLVRELGSEHGFDPAMISFAEFQRRMIQAIGMLRQANDYSDAIDTARALPPVFPTADALNQEGISYQQWAETTITEGTGPNGEVASHAAVLARSRFRAAGDAFAEAAQQKFDTPHFVSTQWSAIDAYQEGRHFRRSIELLKDYLRYEQRRRLPRGLVAYGRALLAEGDEDKAIDALRTCIVEYPRDPLRYDARLLAAMALIEIEKPEEAKKYLIANLQDGELTPQSPAWRDSLFTLGELHFAQASHQHLVAEQGSPEDRSAIERDNQPILEQAIRYLDEAVERYWPASRAESAAYLSARAHVLSSQWPHLESQSPELLEAARRALRTQAEQELQIARDGFVQLKRHLIAREDESRLPPKEQSLVRNCFMAEAETLRALDRHAEAADVYRAIELRYMNEPLALEAILNRAACARELGRKSEAELLLRQAGVVLDRIPGEWDGRFEEMTRFDRNGWQQYLTWMNNRITPRNGA